MKVASIAIRPKLIIITLDKNEFAGEILNKVKLLVFQFASLLQEEIAKIFANKYYSINLYKLCHEGM